MSLKYHNKKFFIVYVDEDAADKHYWFWGKLLRRQQVCFSGYFNAYEL